MAGTADAPPENPFAGRLYALDGLYRSAAAATERFARESGLACPEGCGSCCLGFIPDLLRAEADYLAAWMLSAEPARAAAIAESGLDPAAGTCPLFEPDSPRHCTAYPGRPLVCRLFGFAGGTDKAGKPIFRPCKHMPPSPAGRTGAAAPSMSDFGTQAEGLDPDGIGRRLPLPLALPEALRRLLLLRALGGRES